MKEQFLDDIGLEELIGYIKKYVKDDQDVKPYASYSVFPKTGEQNIIYIDTTNNLTYYWDDTSKTYKALDVQTWDNLSGKPSTFPPSTHNHDDRYYTETEINTKLAGKANSSHTHKKADITDFPTSMPASDVKPWAKADTKPSYSKSEIGLGNVDNTADKDKSVKYATSAGAASSVDWSGVKNKPGTYPPSAHNHNIESLTNFDARVYDAAGTRAANTVLAAPSDSDGTARFRKLVAADLPSHTHNYAGSASAGGAANSSLSLYLNPSTRQTSGDYDMTSSTYACKVTHSVASTIMKTGRPPEDSSVLTFGWDTYAGWGAQLAIGSQKGNHLYVRGANSKQKTVDNKTVNYSEWDSNWRTILDSGNYSSYTVTKTGGGASGNWGINAASASKLTTNAGSSTQPIYFSNGVPVSCAYTLGKSVPSNAVFTDTNTWRPVENSLTSASTSNSLSAAQGKILNELTFQKRNVIDDTVDWDTLKDIGCYKIQMSSWGDANTKHSPNNYSQSLYSFGLLLVFKATDSDGEKRTMQVYFPHQENAGAFNIIMTRMFNNSWWTNWHPIGSGTGWAEILNKPSSYPPSSHTHAISDITDLRSSLDSKLSLSGGTITGQIKRNAGGNWIADRDYAAVFNTLGGGNGYQPVVGQKTATGSWTVGNLGNNESLVFNYCTDANYKANNNTSNVVYLPAQSGTIITSATIGGQSVNYANSAGKLSTSRTISLTGSVTGSGNFDGSGNLTISTATTHTHNSVADINSGATTTFAYSKAGMGYGDFTWLAAWNGSELRAVNKSLFATAGHTHSYLPLSGGTMGGTAFITWADSGNWSNSNKNVTFPVNRGGLQWNGQSDYVKLFTQETGQDNLELVLQFGDDNSNGLSIRNNVGSETARITASGGFTGTFYGNLSGKASTAGTADVANSVAWSNVSGKPGTFTPSSHTHANIVSRGRKNPCASGTTGNNADVEVNVTGLSLTEAYSASTPTSFGNIINVIGAGAGGAGQLFLGWSGADSVTEHLYYRSHRDTTTGGWGPWKTVAFTTDNVASANTLTSNAGSATQPIYFSGGKPVACSYSLSKSVPSNAVFTDTNTWRGCQNNLTSTATDQSLSAAQGKWLNENKLNAINANGYWGMATPSGNSGDWIRTTSAGIIPYQPGGINSSHCGLGTSSWYFNYAYITTCGNSYIGNGQQDNAEGPGGKLNNLVISSWWGVSFTTPCSGQTYSGKTAVGIDCREGIVKAARVNAGSFNGYTINASVPSGAKFTDTNTWRGIQNNLSSDSTSDSLSAAQGKRLKNLIDEKTDIHNLNYGIRFSSSSMDSNGSQNTLYPAKYENGAYSKSTGVSTYANRNNTIHIGTSANMFGDIYLAGGITSLGVYNVTTTTNIPVSVTSQGYLRRYKSGSSLMIKNHIYKIGYDEAKELLNTNVYSFRYNDDGQPANGKEHAAVNRYGFVLEDMEKTFPMAVEYDEYGLPAAWCVQIVVPTILEIVKHQLKTGLSTEIEEMMLKLFKQN